MSTLEQMFPSLTLFSDIDWNAVTKEYEADYLDISFPEYLQQKALEGDCPPYLFELAYFEMALFDIKSSDDPYPYKPGVYLNPTALFLSLEFDVVKMIDEAKKGSIEVIEKTHVLCLYRDKHDQIHTLEMDDQELELLQSLEDGPQMDHAFVSKSSLENFQKFTSMGLILDLFST